ncbi:hypothetical protein M0R45_008771 [Rubus argutus]|uniref:Uncharacterized protein n=1 Tax=Rubus argutus TaxID=59490 RepID=A0AAW1Y5H5_RUBAR
MWAGLVDGGRDVVMQRFNRVEVRWRQQAASLQLDGGRAWARLFFLLSNLSSTHLFFLFCAAPMMRGTSLCGSPSSGLGGGLAGPTLSFFLSGLFLLSSSRPGLIHGEQQLVVAAAWMGSTTVRCRIDGGVSMGSDFTAA